jgi:hypothetical protein
MTINSHFTVEINFAQPFRQGTSGESGPDMTASILKKATRANVSWLIGRYR